MESTWLSEKEQGTLGQAELSLFSRGGWRRRGSPFPQLFVDFQRTISSAGTSHLDAEPWVDPDATVPGNDDGDHDSALGEDVLSETASLSASALDFLEEHGRTYHTYEDGVYLYPNDEQEQDRLDLQHTMINLVHGGKLFLAPIPDLQDPRDVLELGTGTGIWAIEFADSHPASRVLGVDLSPIQPIDVPPNCSFEVFNFENDWCFSRRFDYIFCRLPIGAVDDPDKLLRQVFAHLQPGGRLEIQSVCPPTSEDDTIPEDSAYRIWIDNYCEALERAGRDPYLAQKFEAKLVTAGFMEIEVVLDRIPQNPWPQDRWRKLFGLYNQTNIERAIEGLSLRLFIKHLDWKWVEVQVLLGRVRHDIGNQNIHAHWPLYTVCAQKPTSAGSG